MGLTPGNKTTDLNTPGASSRSFSHNNGGGASNYLFLQIAMSDVVTITSVTYNGVAMTNIGTQSTLSTLTRWAYYVLASPATGSNTVTINFSAAQFNPVSSFAISYSVCGGPGNLVFDDTNTPPNSTTITVSANSQIIGAAVAGTGVSEDITLDGSSRTLEFSNNINNYNYLALSTTGLTAGSKTVSASNSGTVAGYYLEVKEAASNQGNFLMFL